MTTPTRRIRNARLRYPRSYAAARAQRLTARLRSKDIVISAIAQSAADAEAAADALRMERDAAHEECARLSVSGVAFRNIARVFEGLYTSAEADLASADSIAARLVQVICDQDERLDVLLGVADEADSLAAECDRMHEECARMAASHAEFQHIARMVEAYYEQIAARLVEVIYEDAERIATLTAERDHARAIAVALEQGLVVDTRVPMDSDRTPEVER